MEKPKNKTIKEAYVDKALMQKKWKEKLSTAKDVVSASLPNEDPEHVEDIAAKLATESIDGINEVNNEVLDKFINQYGEERGKQIYYATANKQDRSPETFKNESNDEIVSRGIEYGMNPESGDKYDDYRALMQQLADEETGNTAQGIEEVEPVQTNDPVKLKSDVTKLLSKLDMSAIKPYLSKIDNPIEQAEVIAQFAEMIGVPKAKLNSVISQLKIVAETKITKKDLIESVTNRKIIKTIKVKDIK